MGKIARRILYGSGNSRLEGGMVGLRKGFTDIVGLVVSLPYTSTKNYFSNHKYTLRVRVGLHRRRGLDKKVLN